jgi:hypothetical protein
MEFQLEDALSSQRPPRTKDTRCYRMPCEYGRVCIGQTGCSVDIRLEEHQWLIRLEHPDKAAIAEHSIYQGHCIHFHNSSILATKTRYMDRVVREATEIEFHPYNINREGSFGLSKSWKPLISSLKVSGHDLGTLVTQFRILKHVYKQPHSNPSTEAWNPAL